MSTRLDLDWKYRDLQVVRLENDQVCVDVLPELGGKIWNLVHRPSGKNLLWHNPHLPPRRQPFGSWFDDSWAGGWDELLPTDVPTPVAYGDTLPDHGEVWSQPSEWRVIESSRERVSVRFVSYGRVWPTRFEKTLTLCDGESSCRIHYRYTNLAAAVLEFLWNIHPALQVSDSTRLDVPARKGLTDPWSTDRFDAWSEYSWPQAVDRQGRHVDLRYFPPGIRYAEHHYLTGLTAGWWAATDTQAKVGLGLVFPREVFPSVWLFVSRGGWRGLRVAILEASTGYPKDLAAARANGHCGRLEAEATLEADVLAVLYSGAAAVGAIEADGTVVPAS
jgi:hypothetical protein